MGLIDDTYDLPDVVLICFEIIWNHLWSFVNSFQQSTLCFKASVVLLVWTATNRRRMSGIEMHWKCGRFVIPRYCLIRMMCTIRKLMIKAYGWVKKAMRSETSSKHDQQRKTEKQKVDVSCLIIFHRNWLGRCGGRTKNTFFLSSITEYAKTGF